jgi:hypothetical protein
MTFANNVAPNYFFNSLREALFENYEDLKGNPAFAGAPQLLSMKCIRIIFGTRMACQDHR